LRALGIAGFIAFYFRAYNPQSALKKGRREEAVL